MFESDGNAKVHAHVGAKRWRRRWNAMVSSGRMGGGEEDAEVIFVCEDNPSDLKRVSRLNAPPAKADDLWRGMADAERREVFERSTPA
jgi:hypothetical protein